MAVGRERKTGNITISPREHQDGQIQPAEDTLCVILRNSCAFGVNPCRSLGVYREQTNKHSQICREMCVLCQCYHCICVLLLVHRIVYCIIVY